MRAFNRTVVHRRVLINLLSGSAVSGVLVRQDGPLLVLKDAYVHAAGSTGDPVPADGEIVVERVAVDFIQVN